MLGRHHASGVVHSYAVQSPGSVSEAEKDWTVSVPVGEMTMKRRVNLFASLAAVSSLTGFASLCYAQVCDSTSPGSRYYGFGFRVARTP